MDDNRAAVLHGIEDIRIENWPVSEPKENEVLIRMGSVGICGSDIKYWKYGSSGRFTVKDPMVLGHEGSGIVETVGSRVKHLKRGDRVAIEPGIPCRLCDLCKGGRYNLCHDVQFCATPPVHGNIATYYLHPADFCFKLPDHVTMDEGALLEPLSVAIYSCKRGEVKAGDKILICGAGPVGIMTMLVAKSLGVDKVIITDIEDYRLQVAKDLGADHVVKVTHKDHRLLAEEIWRMLSDKPQVALECSGSDDSLNTAIFATASGGTVVLVGRGSLQPSIPIVDAATREVDIKGVFRYANCYPAALAMVSGGTLDLKKLITHHFNFSETEQAFKMAYSKESKAIKVMIHCDK